LEKFVREAYENHLKWMMLQESALEKKFEEGKKTASE
jgi:hypothetical protein